jgi:hypothetical protein
MRCDVNKSFEYNHAFTCTSGVEFFVSGEVIFPPSTSDKPDLTYRSVFGPAFDHNGVVYADSDHNVRLAMRRLTALRDDEQELQNNQLQHIRRHKSTIGKYAENWRIEMQNAFLGAKVEMDDHYADPHPKKALRINAYRDLMIRNERMKRLYLKSVLYKMKKADTARPNKYPRMIGDMGVAASLQGFRITQFIKEQIAKTPFSFQGGVAEFVKSPDPVTMDQVFERLINTRTPYYVYHSDDSVLSLPGVGIFNLDISSCDASHTEALFDLLLQLAPEPFIEDLMVLCDQNRLPIRIVSRDGRRKCVLTPDGARLYSGSTITTLINNLASLLIFISIIESDCRNAEDVIDAAARAGYLVTLDLCLIPEDIQFLKRSPVRDVYGVWRSVLNLGVLLRASGRCKGDLAGRGDLRSRAQAFQYGLLRCSYPTDVVPLLESMKVASGFRVPATVVGQSELSRLRNSRLLSLQAEREVTDKNVTPREVLHFTDEDFLRRYRLDVGQIATLQVFASCATYGEMVSCTAAHRILSKDYGLGMRSGY